MTAAECRDFLEGEQTSETKGAEGLKRDGNKRTRLRVTKRGMSAAARLPGAATFLGRVLREALRFNDTKNPFRILFKLETDVFGELKNRGRAGSDRGRGDCTMQY